MDRHARIFRGRPVEDFDFKEILYDKKDWVATITLNRPESYNAYTGTELWELCEALHDVTVDDKIAVAVITGAGEKAFCTGGDAGTYATIYPKRPHEFYAWWEYYERMLYMIRTCGKPVIARINGVVAGGGNEINLACDLSIATEHARFIQPGTRTGSVSAGGATQWLPLAIGDKRSRWMVMVGDEIDAKTALEWGLVNEVVPYEKLDEAVQGLCEKLIDKFPDCMRYTKVQCNFWGIWPGRPFSMPGTGSRSTTPRQNPSRVLAPFWKRERWIMWACGKNRPKAGAIRTYMGHPLKAAPGAAQNIFRRNSAFAGNAV